MSLRALPTMGMMGVWAISIAMLAACASTAPRRAQPRPTPPAKIADARAETGLAPGETVPSLDALAARGATEAPLMREVLRAAEAAARPIELEAKAADTCFRAIVAANGPVRAWFEDEKRAPRGDVTPGAGLVPPRGPACARKGERLKLVVESSSPGAIARAVVWQAP